MPREPPGTRPILSANLCFLRKFSVQYARVRYRVMDSSRLSLAVSGPTKTHSSASFAYVPWDSAFTRTRQLLHENPLVIRQCALARVFHTAILYKGPNLNITNFPLL